MGLIHATHLERWEEWERSRHRARNLKHAITGMLRGRGSEGEGNRLVLRSRPGESRTSADGGRPGGRILLAVDSASPTSRSSLLTALPYLRGAVDVLQPAGADIAETSGEEWTGSAPAGMTPQQATASLPGRGITTVVSIGQHLIAGRISHRFAATEGLRSFVVQHGVLTPFAPPLPPATTLLSWTDEDADFWTTGRDDLRSRTIGSQLLWQARHEAGDEPGCQGMHERPVFLGQLHGSELPRKVTGGAAFSFCRDKGGLYRPHPSETDLLSRKTHELWRRRGIEFAAKDVPLREMTNPVVAVFSTGVLEAAARGTSSWVYAPEHPPWIDELWDRYGMRRYGAPEPTASPGLTDLEPAAALAEVLDGAI